MSTRMQQRRGTASQWISTNSGNGPILAAGEIGFESDTNKFKIGDGINHWIDLSYFENLEDLGGSLDDYIPLTQRGNPNGVATLDLNALIPVSQLENVIDSAPTGLNTLAKIATSINDDADFAGTIDTALGLKAPLAGPTFTGNVLAPTPDSSDNSTKVATTAFVRAQDYATNTSLSALDGDVSTLSTNLSNHESDTTSVHGITDTSKLVTTDASTQTISGALTITGNLTVQGTTTTVSATDLEITDPLIYIGTGNSANLNDLGIVGHFDNGTYQHTGLVRDASDSKWKLFSGVTTEPTGVIDFSTWTKDTLVVGAIEATDATFSGTVTVPSGSSLGTPTSLTLTNATDLPLTGLTASTTEAIAVGAVKLGHAIDTVLERSSAGVLSVAGVAIPTVSSVNTLTNKSLSASTTQFVDATDPTKKLAVSTSGNTTDVTGTLAAAFTTAKTLTLPDATDTLVGKATTDTLTNKTLTSPVINGGTMTSSVFVGAMEKTVASATAATGTINFDAKTQSVLYYTSNASANWTLNLRGDSSTALNSVMAINDAMTVVFMVTNGSTPYYPTALQIDGTAVTPKYQGGTAWSSGNASSVDAYTYTIIKTGDSAFTVLASQTKFA